MKAATGVAPACLWVPPGRVGSYVDDVAEVAERIGRPLLPEQRLAVDALTAHDKRGRFLSIEAGVEVGRQNGKTGAILLPIILWSLLTEPDHFVWTAHLIDTSNKVFLELADPQDGLIANVDWLRARVAAPSYENGAEGVRWRNGAQLDFRARSARRGRGLSGSTFVGDEWLFGTAEQAAAGLPALATRSISGSSRAYYASSAAKAESKHLRSLRKRALAQDPTVTWVGWWARGGWAEPGCELDDCSHMLGVEGCQLDNEDRWAEANPLLDVMISRQFLRTMRATFGATPMEFGREHMGWQEEGDDAVDTASWASLYDRESRPLRRPVVLVLDVEAGQRSATVLAVGKRADGLAHVEILACRPGVDWLQGYLLDKQRATDSAVWHLAGKHPVASVLPRLKGVNLRPATAAEFAAACTHGAKTIDDRGLRHLGDPILSGALGRAVKHEVGDTGAWVLSRGLSQGDVAPAFCLFLGLWALQLAPSSDLLSTFG